MAFIGKTKLHQAKNLSADAGYFNGQTTLAGFTILNMHIFPCLIHGFDHLIQAHCGFTVTAHSHTRGVDGLDRCDRITLDTRYLHLAGNRVTG